ncbi:N-acetylneuraminate synthase family protein [Akkermansiaceae bacterium]|nr:N-acetylneuraminate synthase family protein [Akkermansiaceae bacterium]
MKIGNRKIGSNLKPLFIAEIGINHNGSLVVAKEMVDSCAKAGVEVVKHQTHIPEFEMSKLMASKTIPGNSTKNIYEIIEECSLDEKDELELKNYVESKGMIFISSPFSLEAIDRLEKFNVPAYKIGSGEMKNYPMLEKICYTGKPLILSTGMHDIEDVKSTVSFLRGVNPNIELALLHTTNLYPTPDNLVRLGALNDLKNAFEDVPMGLSDHTITSYSSFGAIALGASIIEKHYTDTRERIGPDIICSVNEIECVELLNGINILFEQRGGSKALIDEEKVTRDFALATATAIRKIRLGEVFDRSNIVLKRPSKGDFDSSNIQELFGKIANRIIGEGEQITKKDFI